MKKPNPPTAPQNIMRKPGPQIIELLAIVIMISVITGTIGAVSALSALDFNYMALMLVGSSFILVLAYILAHLIVNLILRFWE